MTCVGACDGEFVLDVWIGTTGDTVGESVGCGVGAGLGNRVGAGVGIVDGEDEGI